MTRQRHFSLPSALAFRRGRMLVGLRSGVVLVGLCIGIVAPAPAQTSDQTEQAADQTANQTSSGAQGLPAASDMRVQRIGLIDLDGVLRASKGTARVRELLDEQRQMFQEEFAAREAALQETERKLIAQRDTLSEEDFAQRLADFEAEVATIQKEIQYRREAIDVAFRNAQENMRRIALEIVTDIAREMRLDVVLGRDAVLIYVPRLNISDEVLRRLDERTKDVRIEVTTTAGGEAG